MNDETTLIILVVVVCTGISFLLSGMEAGILALSPLRIRQLKKAGNSRAEVLHQYLERPENFLWTILVGNTIAYFTVLSFLVIFTINWIPNSLLLRILVFGIFVFLFYVLCELLPKMLFRLYPNRLCLFMAQPFRAIHFVLYPLVALAAWVARGLLVWTGGKRFTGHLFGNRDESRFMIMESAHAITSEEKVMINRVLDSQHLPLRQITVPLANAVMVSAETPLSDTLKLARERRLTRLPVWRKEQGRQKIFGIISLKTLLYSPNLDASKSTGEFIRPALYLSEDVRIEEALRRMQRSGQRLAIVLGRDQREVGIVSLQDIIKSIFGEVSL